MTLTEIQKGSIAKALIDKTLYEVGLDFGFDKHYKDTKAVKSAVYRVYQQVKVEPERYFLTPEVMDMITDVVSKRVVAPQQGSLREKNEALDNKDIRELVLTGRDKAMRILNTKMDMISRSKKKLDAVSITALAQTAGILFDKGQIIQGEATENVAVLAKIDKDMKPEDALSMVLKMRELNQVDKDRATKKR